MRPGPAPPSTCCAEQPRACQARCNQAARLRHAAACRRRTHSARRRTLPLRAAAYERTPGLRPARCAAAAARRSGLGHADRCDWYSGLCCRSRCDIQRREGATKSCISRDGVLTPCGHRGMRSRARSATQQVGRRARHLAAAPRRFSADHTRRRRWRALLCVHWHGESCRGGAQC